jgi:hypothetical protein
VNPNMLFNRYAPGGHFSPHTDGYTIIDFNVRSMYSCLIYLNDCPLGGATRMMEESGDALTGHAQVRPRLAAMACVRLHRNLAGGWQLEHLWRL